MGNILFGLFLVGATILLSACAYGIGVLKGEQRTSNIFYEIMKVIDEYCYEQAEKCEINGDPVQASKFYGKIDGAQQMMLCYYKVHLKEIKNGNSKEDSKIRGVLSEMQVRESR